MHRLQARRLTKVIKKKTIVHDISLEVKSREIVGLLGPNGAGKTTTFYMICGLTESTEGKVLLDGRDLTRLPLSVRARMGIGYLPQESSIFKDLSVEENLWIAAEATDMGRGEAQHRIDELLELFNVEPIRGRLGFRLSGGERRRVEIARALVGRPKFLLLDEPFAGVDPIAVEDIQNIVLNLKEKGLGVLITDHNVRETLQITDRSYIMHSGKVLLSGDRHFLSTNKEARELYLGERFRL